LDSEKVQRYARQIEALIDERKPWLQDCKEIAQYILPHRGIFTESGEKPNTSNTRFSKSIDRTATKSVQLLAYGIRGGLTSPSRRWFRLSLQDKDMAEFGPFRSWLQLCEDKIYAAFNRSNFYQSVTNIYEEEAGFGTGCLFLAEDDSKLIRFRPMTCGEYMVITDHTGAVVGFARVYYMQAQQIASQFGEAKLTQQIKNCLEKNGNRYEWFQVAHIVQPRKKRDTTKIDAPNKRWESVYFLYKGERKILRESGFDEQPVMIPRWDVCALRGYGYGPALNALGITKVLQEMQKGDVKAIHMENNPPMRIPAKFKDRINLRPGGHNYIDSNEKDAVGRLFDNHYDIQKTAIKIEDIRAQIESMMFVDVFQMLNQHPDMTATEVIERKQEKLLLLGPMIDRQFIELLDPVISRTFGIMFRGGLLPPPPEEIQGLPMKIEYVSPLAQAQKLLDMQSINTVLSTASGMAEFWPEALDKIDSDAVIDETVELTGATPTIARSADDVQALRKQRAEQQAKMQQMEEEMASTEAAKNLSQADMDGNNALTKLEEAMG